MVERLANMAEHVRRRLEEWKRRLLDLSKRNRLIHFRPSRASSVRIVDELPPEVFSLAVRKEYSLSFRPCAEEASPSETAVYRPYERPGLEERFTDRALQTDLTSERLRHNLLQIYRKAISVREEQGYNTLHLALGFLRWRLEEEEVSSPILLVPADLARTSVRSEFRLRWSGEDVLINPALVQRLKNDYGIDLPSISDDAADFDAKAFFDAFLEAARPLDRAEITNAIYLGLFSFTKFAMYKDLELHLEPFVRNPVVRLLVPGSAESPAPKAPEGNGLDRLRPHDLFQVLDADSSQQEAIEAAKAGKNILIEGPPGTGKSQTIANLLAECLAAGKRVLFVSEKMAALRVVYDRLERAGLGDFCLEVHSQKTNKKRVIAELARVLELPRSSSEPPNKIYDELEATRTELNEYVRELTASVEPLGASPYEAFGILARHETTREVPAFLRGAGQWSKEQWERNRERVRLLARARKAVEPLETHPWRGVGLAETPYALELEIRTAIAAALEAYRGLENKAASLASFLRTEAPRDLEGARALDDLAALLATSPRPEATLLREERWDRKSAEAESILRHGREFARARDVLRGRYGEEILEEEVEPALAWWLRHGDGILRFFRPTYWKIRALLGRQLHLGQKSNLPADLDAVARARRHRKALAAADGSLFGAYWRGTESAWEELERVSDWLVRFRAHVRAGRATEHTFAQAGTGFDAPRIDKEIAALQEAGTRLAALLRLDGGLPERARLEEMERAPERLEEWARFTAALGAAREPDTVEFAGRLDGVPADEYEACFERQFYRSWIEEVSATRPRLAAFDAEEHERKVMRFRDLDRRTVEANRGRARSRLLAGLPDAAWEAGASSELGLLQREVRKKRAHLPLRKLFAVLPRAMARVKPCFMMSPLSVAQYLDPAAELFDLVVFDEASQIAPEDAIGSMARARQAVVVGDTKQLPPTPFFHVETPDAEAEEEPGSGELESILDEAATTFPERRMLRWHYRSRNEDLIAFSNRRYYHGNLFTFPSPGAAAGRPGVEWVYVENGVYDRGGTGRNLVEAERVARAAFDHMRDHPERSVGIGAFSIKQQQAIEDALEELRRADPALEPRFDPNAEEYCFVKNLETIQGDERDAIFLSVGYGPDKDGKVSLNFGPLNQQGGPRRLNVLVTRARERVYVFSSLRPDQIDLSRTESDGVRDLRAYLEYAAQGAQASAGALPSAASSFDSVLEKTLLDRGVEVRRSLGCSEYRIDFAVRTGERSWAVETDGPSYAGAATARDRDRLRSQVLRSLGWSVHRVWSPAWMRNPKKERDRLYAALRGEEPPREATSDASGPRDVAPEPAGEEIVPYRLASPKRLGSPDEFAATDLPSLADDAAEIIAQEGPIHRDELARRIASRWEIPRLGPKVEERVAAAASRCAQEGRADLRGPFYWPAGLVRPKIRRREGSEDPRDIELIAPEELAEAVLLVLRKELRMEEEALLDRTAKILGFTRTGPRVRESLSAAVERLRREGRIVGRGWIETGRANIG